MGHKFSKINSNKNTPTLPSLNEARRLKQQREINLESIKEKNIQRHLDLLKSRIRTCMENGLQECSIMPLTHIESQIGDYSEQIKERIVLLLQEQGFTNVHIHKRPIDKRGVVTEFVVWEDPTSDVSSDKNTDKNSYLSNERTDKKIDTDAPPDYNAEKF